MYIANPCLITIEVQQMYAITGTVIMLKRLTRYYIVCIGRLVGKVPVSNLQLSLSLSAGSKRGGHYARCRMRWAIHTLLRLVHVQAQARFLALVD